jgi:3-hydroxyisobutyrate dehydrogenase-like beta-hydroxyacid dehydrogenase
LSDLGTVVRTGPLGSGAAAKLVANASFFGILTVLGEVLALADALGFEREASRAVLALTPLAQQVERRWPAIKSGTYPRRFALSLACKDAALIRDAGRSAGLATPTLDAAREWLFFAERAGLGEHDYTSVLAAIVATAPNASARG